mgnify:CR=1 FL=1
MSMTPEGKVKKSVQTKLKDNNAYYCTPVTGGFGRSGVPDILACYRGFFVGMAPIEQPRIIVAVMIVLCRAASAGLVLLLPAAFPAVIVFGGIIALLLWLFLERSRVGAMSGVRMPVDPWVDRIAQCPEMGGGRDLGVSKRTGKDE